MPISTLTELVAAGAHRTVEQLALRGEPSVVQIRDALAARYGAEFAADLPTISNLLNRVERGLTIGREMSAGRAVDPSMAPMLPGLAPGYQYTSIISIDVPEYGMRPAHMESFPWHDADDLWLTYDELARRIEIELAEWRNDSFGLSENPGSSDTQMRARGAQRVIHDVYGGVPVVDVQIMSVYRGA